MSTDTAASGDGSSVVVVGGGLAGGRTCAELRRQGYSGSITLLSDESVLPYDRPPLSKAVLHGKRETKPLKIDYTGLGVDVRLGWRADSLDIDARRVAGPAGAVQFGQLVIATGSSPVLLPGNGEQLVLRTDADARRLRERLTPEAHVVVIGAGWIGGEVATAALARGSRVTCVELATAPLAPLFGMRIGQRITPWWGEADLRLGVGVVAVEHGGVALSDGSFLAADVIVSGIGSRPGTEWLKSTGLELGPGILTDEYLRASSEGVLAAGDAATWYSRRFGRHLHVEHWDNASGAAAVIASSIVNGASSELVHDPVPYFWSDQFGHRLEYVGHHGADDEANLVEDDRGWTARWTGPDGQLTAALTVDRPEEVAAARKLIAARVSAKQAGTGAATLVELLAAHGAG